ncbi:Uncharacterized membrane protein HdeD, DUF308 family [Thermoflavifilum thermophilum]|uniref:Uncharacterized membrane protein HdeD, DUF308 family n=1 Tax=Thermoflavifilum thermophilum TaxID=1393122 RepID=A0A1I7NIA2_9BACT|nr:Uncharacterized membrane protein HdeD, DUF308 family [Thermoflavifilum thermophilum]
MELPHESQSAGEKVSFLAGCELSFNWWAFIIRGLLALIFALLAFFMPVTAIFALTIVFGAFSFADGIFAVVLSVRKMQKGKHWGWLLFSGILGILTGLVVFFYPLVSTVVLAAFLWASIGIWSMLIGLMEFISAFRLRREIKGEVWLMLSGIFSIMLGFIILWMFFNEPASALLLSGWVIGINALISAVTYLLLGYRLKKHHPLLKGSAV